MSYKDLLEKDEWGKKCNAILQRDKHQCKECGRLGSHAWSSYKCIDLSELDRLIDLKIYGRTVSEYLLSQENNDKFCDIIPCVWESNHHINNQQFMALSGSIKEDVFSVCPNAHFLSSKIVKDLTVKGKLLLSSKDVVQGEAFFGDYRKGSCFKFDETIYEGCGLRVQHCVPKRVYDNFNDLDAKNAIILTVFYNNIVLCLYFDDTTTTVPSLNIHHKYYIDGNSPWEYDDNALITLCESCHKKVHQSAQTPVYRKIISKENIIGYKSICPTCGGSGYRPEYYYYEDGVCFDCGGEGVIM